MKVQINFKIINSDYNQEYADEYNFGKEGDSNWKYNWAVTYELSDVKSVELINNGVYQLNGKFKEGNEFSFAIPNVTIFRFHLENSNIEDFAVSTSILNKIHQAKNEKFGVTRCYFYINDSPSSVQLGNNLLINESEIPKELLTYK